METEEEPALNLRQTLEWLRKELLSLLLTSITWHSYDSIKTPLESSQEAPLDHQGEMQAQDQRLLLTLRHLHSVLEELRAERAHWEDARSPEGASPIRARAGSEGTGRQPTCSRELAQLLQEGDSRRSSLP